jgi:hypothetical protein
MPRSYPPEFRRKVLYLLKAGRKVDVKGGRKLTPRRRGGFQRSSQHGDPDGW